MTESRYPAARTSAARLADHFARHAAAGPACAAAAGPLPDAETIETLIDAAFWASLQREEGYVPEIPLLIFAWSPREAMVHAHRVETLLL